jgi:hypothetical protein
MAKIVMIGAGSAGFCRTFVQDMKEKQYYPCVKIGKPRSGEEKVFKGKKINSQIGHYESI